MTKPKEQMWKCPEAETCESPDLEICSHKHEHKLNCWDKAPEQKGDSEWHTKTFGCKCPACVPVPNLGCADEPAKAELGDPHGTELPETLALVETVDITEAFENGKVNQRKYGKLIREAQRDADQLKVNEWLAAERAKTQQALEQVKAGDELNTLLLEKSRKIITELGPAYASKGEFTPGMYIKQGENGMKKKLHQEFATYEEFSAARKQLESNLTAYKSFCDRDSNIYWLEYWEENK